MVQALSEKEKDPDGYYNPNSCGCKNSKITEDFYIYIDGVKLTNSNYYPNGGWWCDDTTVFVDFIDLTKGNHTIKFEVPSDLGEGVGDCNFGGISFDATGEIAIATAD